MKRSISITLILTLAALLLVTFIGINYYSQRDEVFPFRCSTFSHYDLSRKEGERIDFLVTQDLRFEKNNAGYLLLNGQVNGGDSTTLLNRRIVLIGGGKTGADTYRYKIDKIITSSTDTTPDALFNLLLAEITLDPSYLQLDVDRVDDNTYLIGGPLSYLFTCQRY